MQYLGLAVLGLTLASLVCGEDGAGACTSVVTYNAGLLTQVPNHQFRESLIQDALRAIDADVICLQEYWLESQVERLLQKTQWGDMYHYSALHSDVGQLRKRRTTLMDQIRYWWAGDSACSEKEYCYFEYLIGACIKDNGCEEIYASSPVAGTVCALNFCSQLFASDSIKADCVSCLVMFSSNLREGDEVCRFDRENKRNRLNSPGLVLLSKKPMTSAKYVNFHEHDTSSEHGYIEAEIEDLGKVYCSHLTSIFNVSLEYDPKFESYQAQQRFEIESLIQATADEDHVLMGDFNTGPEIAATSVTGEVPENYPLFTTAGYRNTYTDEVGSCTFCNYTRLTAYPFNVLIDHVFVKGDHLYAESSERILDAAVSGTYLSDHFGVKVNLCKTD